MRRANSDRNRRRRQERQTRSRYRRLRNRTSFFEVFEQRLVLSSTPQLIDIAPTGGSDPAEFTQVGDRTYFVAARDDVGRELWVTDGSPDGTRLVRDIQPGGGSSNPSNLTELNGELYFAADDGANGEELWKTDGTEVGTQLVRDIFAGTGYQYPYGNGPLQSFPRDLTNVGGVLFFSAEDDANGGELWSSDGSTQGTELVRDIFPSTYTDSNGTYPNSSNPQDLVNVNGTLFFTAVDDANGRELWKSNGTESGTVLIKDIFTGTYPYSANGTYYGQYPNSSNPEKLTAVDGALFFVADDGTNGRELWKSDGTATGTQLVRDIRSGTEDGIGSDDPLTADGATLFFVANDGSSGRELWQSNGSTAGTELVLDIQPGSGDAIVGEELVAMNGRVFFAASDNVSGVELWSSDGSAGSTRMVADIADQSGDSSPQYLTAVDNLLFFSAVTSGEGRELWESDGTESGTQIVSDLLVGPDGSQPEQLAASGNTLLFSADDGLAGRELWTTIATEQIDARLTIFANGEQVVIPANVGVDFDGSRLSQVTTTDSLGSLTIQTIDGEPIVDRLLEDFFETWRINGGQAGDNSAAFLSSTQLMGNVADTQHTVQMIVNGQPSDAYENYVVQDGDEIILVYGDTPVVSLNTNFGSIVFELFAGVTPITVDNFLNYVNDGDYINSFFHRSVNDFVIQGGGFKTTSPTFSDTAQFASVPTDPPITNEFNLSNIRGTVAMAKLGNDPNSATSQFFVSLKDNGSILDGQNGGFTVFGQVLDMTAADRIANLPVEVLGASPFGEVPIDASDQLVVVQSVEGQGWIRGTKYRDQDNNGNQDPGEAGLAGVTVYVDANDNGTVDANEISTLTDASGDYVLQVAPGTYVVRAEVSTGSGITQPVSVSGSYTVNVEVGRDATGFDFGETSIEAPTSVDLVASSDSGSANDDDLTNRNNADGTVKLTFSVEGVLDGAEVRLFSDGTQIGSAVSSGTSVTVETDGLIALADGTRQISAIQIRDGSTSSQSPALSVVIDTAAPAAIQNTAPDLADVEQLYAFDADSPDESLPETSYRLSNAPDGMVIDQDGNVRWTPSLSQQVPQEFAIQLQDAAGNAAAQTVDLTVLGVIPAYPDSYTGIEDITFNVTAENGVLDNDAGVLTAVLVSDVSHGVLSLQADGGFSYAPSQNFFGTDSFTYQATSNDGTTNVAKVTLEIENVNDGPLSLPDAYTVEEDTPLVVGVEQGLLHNDLDSDGDLLTASISTQPANGLVVGQADGTFTYTPDQNFNGVDFFEYQATDGLVTTDAVTVTVTVSSVNDAPVGQADSFMLDEDGVLNVDAANGVLSNDADAESDVMTVTVASSVDHGVLSLDGDGGFRYEPDDDFFGVDSFTYTISDGFLESATVTVNLTVSGQPDPPTAEDDETNVLANSTGQSVDVLGNDTTAPDGTQNLTIVSVTQGTTGGTVALNGGAIEYSPESGFQGTDTFTYTIQDEDGLSDTATVTVTVDDDASNRLAGYVYLDADGDGDRGDVEEGIPGAVITLMGTSSAGDEVTRTALTNDEGFYAFEGLPGGSYQIVESQPEAMLDGGESTDVPDATVEDDRIENIVITGNAEFVENNFGEAKLHPQFINIQWFFSSTILSVDDVLREVVAQGESLAGNKDLAEAIRDELEQPPADLNSPPVAVDDVYVAERDEVLAISAVDGVLENDSDGDGDSLVAEASEDPTNGSLSFNSDGSFSYTPDAGYVGDDQFTYLVKDGRGGTATGHVSLTVGDVTNQLSIDEGSSEGATVGTITSGGTLSQPLIYDFQDDSRDSNLNLVPDDHLSGDPSAPLVLIEYLDYQCPACATFHSVLTELEEQFAGDLLVVSRHYPLIVAHPNAFAAALAAEAAGRQDKFEEMGELLFGNQADWESVSDPQSFFDQYAQTLNLDMTQFAADIADPTTSERVTRDREAAIDLGNDTTPVFYLNGEAISPSSNVVSFAALLQAELDELDEQFRLDRITGEINVADAGALDYEQTPMYSLDVQVTDSDGGREFLDVTIVVNDVNEKPVASADAYQVDQGGLLEVNSGSGVIANDSDPEGDALNAVLQQDVANGNLLLESDGAFVYTPVTGFFGTDTFTYLVEDGELDSDTVTVTISVVDVNVAPLAVADAYVVDEDDELSVDVENGLLSNDSDADSDDLTVQLALSVSSGTLNLEDDGSFIYTPDDGFSGQDSFTYRASDGELASDIVTVTLNVNFAEDPTIAVSDEYDVNEDTTLIVDALAGVLANDTDDDGPLTATVVDQPDHGTLTFDDDGSFTYVPDANYHGDDTFVYTATDGSSTSSEATVTIRVASIADGTPEAVADEYTTDVDLQLSVNAAEGVLANDNDPDSKPLTATVVDDPGHGTLALADDGSFTYTPDGAFHGEDSFTYSASNGVDATLKQVVTVFVNRPPTVNVDSYSVFEDNTLTVDAENGVLMNDSDFDEDELNVAVEQEPSSGALSLSTDGSFIYVPESNFSGSDSFTYRASDGIVESDEVAVSIGVDPVNDVPVAGDDAYSVTEGNSLAVGEVLGLLANDTDDDGEVLDAVLLDDVANGTLSLNKVGSFNYTPDQGFVGTDTFTYQAEDSATQSNTATVSIEVIGVNTFDIAEGNPAGAVVGQLVPDTATGTQPIYQVVDPALDPLLELAPDDHLSGDAAAPLVLIEYLDFQCPGCRLFHPEVEQLKQDFAGELLVIQRHLPLTSIHANAFSAALASEAAARQGKFEEMADLLFENQDDWEDQPTPQTFFDSYASQLGLDVTQFQADMQDQALTDRVSRDRSAAIGLGAPGTPTFYLNGQPISPTTPNPDSNFGALIQSELDVVDDVFKVDRRTGEILLLDPLALDAGTTPTYSFTVKVADSEGQTDTLTVTINVLPVVSGQQQGGVSAAAVDQLMTELF